MPVRIVKRSKASLPWSAVVEWGTLPNTKEAGQTCENLGQFQKRYSTTAGFERLQMLLISCLQPLKNSIIFYLHFRLFPCACVLRQTVINRSPNLRIYFFWLRVVFTSSCLLVMALSTFCAACVPFWFGSVAPWYSCSMNELYSMRCLVCAL